MTIPDPTVNQAEPEAEPTAPASPEGQSAQGNVTELLEGLKTELSGRLAKLEADVKAAAGRGSNLAQTQSEINKTQSTLRDGLARLEQYKKQYNYTDEEAIAEIEADDAEAEWRTRLEKQIADLTSLMKSGGTGSSVEQNVTKVFTDILGEEAIKDARVADALGKNYGSLEEAQNAAYRLSYQLSHSPSPNAAQGASLDGKATSPNVEKLLVEMDALMTGNDMDAIKAKGEELKQAGAPGWT